MVYAVRTLFMPLGEELSSMTVTVVDGRVESVADFVSEAHSMIFVNEVHIAASSSLSSLRDIIKNEAHQYEGPLYAYSADAAGNLVLLD